MTGLVDVRLNEGSLTLPPGWAERSQCVIYRNDDDASLVVTFAPSVETFEQSLQAAADALPDYRLLDRRLIQIDGRMGDYAEMAFTAGSRPFHQLVVRVATSEGRAATFQANVPGTLSPGGRQEFLRAIGSFRTEG